MPKFGLWWLFLFAFAALVVGIFSLNVSPRQRPVRVAPSMRDPAAAAAAIRHLTCQPRHWRKLVTQR